MVTISPYPADPRPRRMVEALLKEGASVDLICQGDEKGAAREKIGALDIKRLPIPHLRAGKLAYAYEYSSFITVSSAILAARSLRRRYDLVYVNNMPDVLVASALFPKMLGAKVILDMHDPMPELMTTIYGLGENSRAVSVIKRLEKWSFARAHKVLTVNVACKRIFSNRSCAAEKIGVVMNTPDDGIFPVRAIRTSSARASKPFTIMYHGSIVERNGLDLAVEALEHVRKTVPEAILKVYGKKNAFLGQVLQQAQSKGLKNAVEFMGPRSLEGLVAEIEQCDVGVIPNQRNPFTDINTPTRIFEYLAVGKPVVVPRTLGILDYFDTNSLYFFESGNAKELAEQIERVYANPVEANAIAERGQKIFRDHAWPQERQALIDMVREVLKGKKR
jgi:glycosyltransferase involved in cell wall biosynthesis